MTLREWKKNLVKTRFRKDWISSIYVKTSSGRIVDLLCSFTGNYYNCINPSLKKMCLDSEVVQVRREGPYNSSYCYSVLIDLEVKSVITYHTVEVKLTNGKVLSSRNKFNHVCANEEED